MSIDAYRIETSYFEHENLAFFEIYLRADELLHNDRYILDANLPTAYYFRLALWELLFLFHHRSDLSKDHDFFHKYFEVTKYKNAIHYEDEVVLVNCIVYQIALRLKDKNTLFFNRICEKIVEMSKWCFDKFPNTETIWYSMAGKPVNPKEYVKPQIIHNVINNFLGETIYNDIHENTNPNIHHYERQDI